MMNFISHYDIIKRCMSETKYNEVIDDEPAAKVAKFCSLIFMRSAFPATFVSRTRKQRQSPLSA